MPNKHIEEFLNYYLTLSNPQYAVLLKGKWGSGKTYFINEYKNELDKNKKKYIYVSLYGVTSYDEIETKFLETIHPKLYNKKTIFAGKIAKQLLKGTLKIDLDDDGKTDGNISAQIPNFKPEDLLNTKDYILIFDDLERCSINIIDLLGYINFFVEHQSYKVIVIANEEELEKTEKYISIKEKLIGKTFEFKSDPISAYDNFLLELKNTNNNILIDRKKQILELFEKSESNNLRALRQSLLDFERFYDDVLICHSEKKDLIHDILYWFFLFSFEIKQGNNDILDLPKLSEEYHGLLIENDNQNEAEKTKYKLLLNKYNLDNNWNVIISFDLWREILIDSNIRKNEINNSLENSKYYFDENTPSWKKLTFYYNLEDDEFEKLLNDVYRKFCNNEYKDYKHLKLVASMLLYFQENQLLKIEDVELFNLSKDIFEKNNFDIEKVVFIKNELIGDRSYQNISYFKSDFFNKLVSFLDKLLEDKKSIKLKDDSKSIIKFIEKGNTDKLFELLEGKNDIRKIDYKDKPILADIKIDDLFEALLKTNGLTMHCFGGILKDRYKNGKNELLIEKDFLKNLLKDVEDYINNNKYKLSSYNLKKEIKENILIAINEIEK